MDDTPTEEAIRIVRIDPRFAPEHAAYYLQGLLHYTSARELPLSKDGFPDRFEEKKPLAAIVRLGQEQRNIFIAADDMPELDTAALEWADVYGKVNLKAELVPPHHRDKVIPVGPSHAQKIWTNSQAMKIALLAHRAGGRLLEIPQHYRQYWILQTRRLDETYYAPGQSEDRYIFYNSWLWSKHADANPPRAEFMRACREIDLDIEFEGGFIARRRSDVPGYEDLIADRKYPLEEYLRNIKRSTVVFNNPAAHGCLGWKLGEFFRLGKAIISLPLSRDMPEPVRHGHHIHVVDGSRQSMKEGIARVVEDPPYRRHLERSAREYYLKHLAPEVVIARLVQAAFELE